MPSPWNKNAAEDLLAHKSAVESFLEKSPRRLSAFSFVNIYAWKDFFEFRFEVIAGALCIFAQNELGCFLYLPPLGDDVSAEVIDQCFAVMENRNQGSGVSRVENVSAEQLKLFPPPLFTHFQKSCDYYYRRQDLVDLKGNAFKSKRNLYNHLIKNFRVEYHPFHKDFSDGCAELYKQWAHNRLSRPHDEIYRQMIEENRIVHQETIKNHEALNLVGRVALIDQTVRAYTFGYALNAETFCVLFEIADLSLKGLSTYIFRELCRVPQIQLYGWINAMDDFALENIARTKRSFRPCWTVPSYTVRKNNPR